MSLGGTSFGFTDDSSLTGTYIVNTKSGVSAQSISANLQKQFDDLKGAGDVEVASQSSTPGAQTIDVTLTATDPRNSRMRRIRSATSSRVCPRHSR